MSTSADHALCRDGNTTLFLPEFTNWRWMRQKTVESEKMSMKTDENAKYIAKIAENKLNCPNLNFVELRGTSKSIKISSKNTWFILVFWS